MANKHMSMWIKAKSRKYLENLPSLEKREIKEPVYTQQWWETPFSYRLFSRYYLPQGGNRSIAKIEQLLKIDESDISPDLAVVEQLPQEVDKIRNSKISSWMYFHAKGNNPYTGEELDGPIMTWDERAAVWDLATTIQERDKLSIIRGNIIDDELSDYNLLIGVARDMLKILKERVDNFRNLDDTAKTSRKYSSLINFAERVVSMREKVDKLGRRAVGLPEHISEDRFATVNPESYEIKWIEPEEFIDGNKSITGDVIYLESGEDG